MRLLAPLLLLPFVAIGAGCRTASRPKTRFSQPRPGVARLLFTRVGPEHVKWSLIGERNWTKPKSEGSTFALEDVYPLNATDRRGGTHVWEFDLETKTQGGKTSWKARLHGSNGATATSSGESVGEVQLQIDADTELVLPADQTLAKLGTTRISLALPR